MSEKTKEHIEPEEKKEEDIYKRLNAFRPPENVLKKHPCKDCYNCLFCGDARCAVCLNAKKCSKMPLVILKSDK